MTRIALLKQSCRTKGGLEKQTLALIQAFLKEKVDVDLLVQGPCQLDIRSFDKVNLQILSNKKMGSWWSLCSYDKALDHHFKKQHYDVIFGLERHSHQTHYRAGSGVHRYFLNQRIEESDFLKKLGLQLNPFHQKILQLENMTFGPNGAKRIYTNSHWIAHQIHNFYQTSWDRLCVIHNGVQWQSYQQFFDQIPYQRHQLCESLKIDPSERYLGFIGHGFHRKGLDLALDWLKRSHNDFHLLVVGKDKHSHLFQKQVNALGLDHRVHFLGTTTQILPILGVIERLILPTRYDPFANVTLEALALGVDVWTSTTNGASEILPFTSFDFDLKANEAWIAAIEKLWQHSPASFEEKKATRQSVAHLELERQTNLLVQDILASI